MDGVLVALRIDHPYPLRVAAGALVLALRDQALQLDSLALEAVGLPPPDPGRRRLRAHTQQDRHVGPDPAGRLVADLLDPVGSEPPRHPLIGDARIAEPVADDVLAPLARGSDHLRDELGARGAEEEELAQRVELERRILEQSADPLPCLRPARLTYEHDVVAERPGEQLGLRRLARAVDSLE